MVDNLDRFERRHIALQNYRHHPSLPGEVAV
jgi:hypothetical protein